MNTWSTQRPFPSILTLIPLDLISLVHFLLVNWLPSFVLKISGQRPL